MQQRLPLSAIIITLNEESNLSRCLKSVQWVPDVLVVDAGSQDKTCELAEQLGARVLQHQWEGYGQQKNWALSQVKNDWVLSIDADEEVSAELRQEIEKFIQENGRINGISYDGVTIPRKTWFLGRWILHGGWYPNCLVRLARRSKSQWTEPAVHEEWQVDGAIHKLKSDILHYTFRDVGEQVQTNIRFSRLGAKVALARGEVGSIAKILLKPIGKFLETYLWKRGFLDGLPGFVISINAAHSIFMKYVELRFEKNTHH